MSELSNDLRSGVRRGGVAVVQGLTFPVLGLGLGLPLFVLFVLSSAFLVLGIGFVLLPLVVVAIRNLATLHRRFAAEWAGLPIASPYRPAPAYSGFAPRRAGQRVRWMLRDPATWRDLLWLLGEVPVGLLLGLLPAVAVVSGVEGIVVPQVLWMLDVLPNGYGFGTVWPIETARDVGLAVSQGVLLVLIGLLIAPWALWAHSMYGRLLLAPTRKSQLALRVTQLTRTRTETVDAQAAELRRIERDLHDGAQARLVSLAMSIGMAEDLIGRDPDGAKALLVEARESSVLALSELRDLVAGIHPPILAERGLDGAIRALAMALPIAVECTVLLPGRPPAPVESALYFAASEALTNVARHSGAASAWIELESTGTHLRLTVGDRGRGGASIEAGTGLRGVERRLSALDGTLALSSPSGGPTVVLLEIPCVLSSPKTSRSFGTA
ncbi:sensor histidine kinase [Cryptosporangium arvum]|uniref:histidine kinase n=1 Tax=Cryptosporangium arvum DSM 44712 TaxID=927661 RepID=A0A011ACE6_9ACTN|nr:sensor histidine kinase [Cryptosporangium arvum]EXG79706.1 signal transduction histidine kinase [Cryptosporangium arvum DSM 44712]